MHPDSMQKKRDPEELISDFAETTHVPTTYLNYSLSAVGTHVQITAAVQSLLADLEMASDIASKKLNVLVDDMLRTAPRLGYDVEVLRGELMGMRGIIQQIEPKRAELAGKGGASIKKLAMLENVKEMMQETDKILMEAQAWRIPESIEESIYALISAKEYSAASKEVLNYEGLLLIYKGTSEYARRKAVVDRLRKKLLEVKQDGPKRASLDLARSSLDTQHSTESSGVEDSIYASFIKRAFKT